MENLALIQIPAIKPTDRLLDIANVPIIVEENALFVQARELRDTLIQEAEKFRFKIESDKDYNRVTQILPLLPRFKKYVDDTTDPVKKDLNDGKQKVMDAIHTLCDPIDQLNLELKRAHGNYKNWRDEQVRLENEKLQREAERERQRLQRLADLETLQSEIRIAQSSADEGNGRGQTETANEINVNLEHIIAALAVPDSIKNPLETCTRVRQIVALALQHEDARIAAAKAKAEGDKKAAAAILKASAKLEAPEVEEVQQTRVEVTPAIQRGPDLVHARGSSIGQVWRVKRQDIGGGKQKTVGIIDPQRVARDHPEFCLPDEGLLNEYARRCKEMPIVPGVIFELEIKTKGVR